MAYTDATRRDAEQPRGNWWENWLSVDLPVDAAVSLVTAGLILLLLHAIRII